MNKFYIELILQLILQADEPAQYLATNEDIYHTVEATFLETLII